MGKKIKTSTTKKDRIKNKLILTVSAMSLVAVTTGIVITTLKSREKTANENPNLVSAAQEQVIEIEDVNVTEPNEYHCIGFVNSQIAECEDIDEEIQEDIMEDQYGDDEYVEDEYWEEEYEEDEYWEEEYEEDEYWEEEYIEPEEEEVYEEEEEMVVETIPAPPVVEALSIYEEEPEIIEENEVVETSENAIVEETTVVNTQESTENETEVVVEQMPESGE